MKKGAKVPMRNKKPCLGWFFEYSNNKQNPPTKEKLHGIFLHDGLLFLNPFQLRPQFSYLLYIDMGVSMILRSLLLFVGIIFQYINQVPDRLCQRVFGRIHFLRQGGGAGGFSAVLNAELGIVELVLV